MNLNKALKGVMLALILLGLALYGLMNENKTQADRKRVDSLVNVSRQAVAIDSIISRVEARWTDSLTTIRERMQADKEEIRVLNLKVNRQNEKIIRLYRDIDLSDRPDF